MIQDFLLEIGCEELPPKLLNPLALALTEKLKLELDKAQLGFGALISYATPRRIAVKVCELSEKQADSQINRRGPSVQAAFDDAGNPTPAAIGFARSCGVTVECLTRETTDKGAWLNYQSSLEGRATVDLLPEIVNAAVAQIPMSKPMRWGAGSLEFTRPVHWVLMLYGDTPISARVLNLVAGNKSYGHRFHHPQALVISHPGQYEQALYEANVVVDFQRRQQIIKQQIEVITQDLSAVAIMPQELLDEVTAIVEWPQALRASFDSEFLKVPAEALIAAMQGHQKSFALTDATGTLLPYFITVANIASTRPEQVIQGNQKVMNARLSDAAFFYQQDTAKPLIRLQARTQSVIFQQDLGSIYDKTQRVWLNAEPMAQDFGLDAALLKRAVELSRCDLMSEMVLEFPELQGIMGYYYALHDNESECVAQALRDQYLPRYSGDDLPRDGLSRVLSLADRLDTLVGIFGIKQKPKGVKDPFKLRRHALAIVRILSECQGPFKLSELLSRAIQSYGKQFSQEHGLLQELHEFIIDRLTAWYHGKGYEPMTIKACLSRQEQDLFDLSKRLDAVQRFVQIPQAEALTGANKRVRKLLASVDIPLNGDFQTDLFELTEERQLAKQVVDMEHRVAAMLDKQDYYAVLEHLSSLDGVINEFFDGVMVMVEDEAVRINRLNLLTRLRGLFLRVADISFI